MLFFRELVECNVLIALPYTKVALLTHLTTRLGMRAKYKQDYITHSEVACAHSYLTLIPSLIIVI